MQTETETGMEIVIVIAAVWILVMVKFIAEDRSQKRRKRQKLRESWGEVPEEEYTSEKFQALGHYYRSLSLPEDHIIDDITWNDLNLDELFMTMNQTGCAMGEEYLYALLHQPLLEEETLKERDRLMDFFTREEETRLDIQEVFQEFGKLQNYSVHEYVNMDHAPESNTVFHVLCCLGFAASILWLILQPSLGVVAFFAMLIHNVAAYTKRKSQIDPYIEVFGFLIRMQKGLKKLISRPVPELEEYQEKLRHANDRLKEVSRGRTILVSGSNAKGSVLDVVLDYVRMLFHLDLIKFDFMVRQIIRCREDVNQVYETVGLLDSMIACGSYRVLCGDYAKPEFTDGAAYFEAEELAHPYLDEPVSNSILCRRGVLITGSNASGKSTFLKTAAINALLAQTIDTVLGRKYRASMFRIATSMSLRDDIIAGDSYYIAEIKSLKRILDRIPGRTPLLCCVDEVLRGTNTLERIAASSEILRSLSGENVICFGATHDIELTSILSQYYDNYHFEEQVREGQITFDYRLYKGKATTRNAILLLSIMGYFPEIIQSAQDHAAGYLREGKWAVLKP